LEDNIEVSRRDAVLMLPMLYALPAMAGEKDNSPPGVFSLTNYRCRKAKAQRFATFWKGKTATGDYLEIHETVLEPGGAPHPPHHHDGEEMFLVIRGDFCKSLSREKFLKWDQARWFSSRQTRTRHTQRR